MDHDDDTWGAFGSVIDGTAGVGDQVGQEHPLQDETAAG